MKKSKLLIISLLLLLVSCGSSVEVKGSWDDKTYENKYFLSVNNRGAKKWPIS